MRLAFSLPGLFSSRIQGAAGGDSRRRSRDNQLARWGVPLRVYLTKRLPKRIGEPVHAKVLEPVFSFNREVIPAGAEVTGTVSKLTPVSKFQRFSALLGGDFTPLHQTEVEFNSVTFADGHQVAFHTVASTGLNSIYSPSRI